VTLFIMILSWTPVLLVINEYKRIQEHSRNVSKYFWTSSPPLFT